MRSGLIFLAQIAGGICAAAVVSCLFPGPLSVETTLGGGTSISQGLFIEMFLTAQLVFVIIMLAVVKHRSTYLAPVGIGLTFFLTELCGMFAPYLSGSCVSLNIGIYFTGGSLNFARSLGPAAVNHHFPGYFWIYFVGPLLGSLLATGFYWLLNRLRYQTCNPGQDYGEPEEERDLKHESESTMTGMPGTPPKFTGHGRNVSGATAVNQDVYSANQAPAGHHVLVNNQVPQSDIAPITNTADPSLMQTAYHEPGQRHT